MPEPASSSSIDLTAIPVEGKLFAKLYDAISQGNDTLTNVFRENAKKIFAAYAAWLTSGNLFARTPQENDQFWNCMYVIAKFADHNVVGSQGLFKQLVAQGQDNPFSRWERKIDQALQLIRELDFEQAAKVLSDHLIDQRERSSFGYSHMSATTHWYLSQCYHNLRRRDEAVGHAERALAVTTQIGDHPSYLFRYLRHLWQVHRYFGEALSAAVYARRLCEFLSQSKGGEELAAQILYFRRQAELLEQLGGEPLTRVVGWIGRQCYEFEDVQLRQGKEAQVNLTVERNRCELIPSRLLMARSREVFQQQQNETEALALLRQAAEADPHSPDPHQNMGRLLLTTERYTEAVEAFEKCEELAPGWPQCRRELWLAQRLAAGACGPEVMSVWHEAVEARNRAEAGLARMTELVEQNPGWGFLHLLLGNRLVAEKDSAKAREEYIRGLECEKDIETQTALLVGLAQLTEDRALRERLLHDAIALNGDLAAAAGAKLLLRQPTDCKAQ